MVLLPDSIRLASRTGGAPARYQVPPADALLDLRVIRRRAAAAPV